MAEHETVFNLEATPVKYGAGAVADAGCADVGSRMCSAGNIQASTLVSACANV